MTYCRIYIPTNPLLSRLKSKSNVKRDHSLGTINKNRIWGIIPWLCQKKGFKKGITLTDILEETKVKFPPNGFSKPTIISALEKLQVDGRILKFKRRYFLLDIFVDDGWSIFAGYLNFLLQHNTFHNHPVHVTRMGHTDPEKDLGEIFLHFSNYIGTFILYLLIEAMRPTRTLIPKSLRIDKTLNFIKTAIPHEDLIAAFLNFLSPIYNKDVVLGTEIRRDRINTYSNAFRKTYPSIHQILEDGYIRYFKEYYFGIRDDKCKHVWEKTFIHKFGRMYSRCTGCGSVVKSRPSSTN